MDSGTWQGKPIFFAPGNCGGWRPSTLHSNRKNLHPHYGTSAVMEPLRPFEAIPFRLAQAYARVMHVQQTYKWVERARDLWCEAFHDEPMWPINGKYQCRSCLRYHVVRWEVAAVPQVAEMQPVASLAHSLQHRAH